MNSWIDFAALGKVLAASLIGGVGVAVLFALGLRATSSSVADIDLATGVGPAPAGARAASAVLAALCFAAVVAAVAAGIWVILTD